MINRLFSIISVVLFMLFSFCVTQSEAVSSWRSKTIEGTSLIRKQTYSSMFLLAKSEFKKGNYNAALKSVEYYLDEHPQDWKGWALKGELLFRKEQLSGSYQSFKRAWDLSSDQRVWKRMNHVQELVWKGVEQEVQPKTVSKAADSEDKKKLPVTEQGTARASLEVLSRMTALQSIFQGRGADDDSSWDSIKSSLPSSQAAIADGLGELEFKNGSISSSIYGTVAEQQKINAFYKEALKRYSEGKKQEAASLLSENITSLYPSEFQFLFRILEESDDQKSLFKARMRMADLYPGDAGNLFEIAEYYYRDGQTEKAILYYTLLHAFPNSWQKRASRRIKYLNNGGTWKLEKLFKEQKKQMLEKVQ
jgi:tetratricopeptide (TPR) repeat protein